MIITYVLIMNLLIHINIIIKNSIKFTVSCMCYSKNVDLESMI